MSDDQSSPSKLSIGIIIILLLAVGLLVANTVTSQSKMSQLQKELETAKKDVIAAQEQVVESKKAVVEETTKQAQEIAEAVSEIESPAARFALVKRFYTKVAAALKPDTKAELDDVIIYIERTPIVLVDPKQLPASMSAILTKAKAELSAAKGTVATQKFTSTTTSTASPSAVVGKTFNLTGTLTFVADDPVMGGSYFKLTDTNYGEPFVLYLNGATATTAKSTMDGKVVTAQVRVTSEKDGFVTYDVISGPTLAE